MPRVLWGPPAPVCAVFHGEYDAAPVAVYWFKGFRAHDLRAGFHEPFAGRWDRASRYWALGAMASIFFARAKSFLLIPPASWVLSVRVTLL